MLAPNPINRPTISEILEHPWIRVSSRGTVRRRLARSNLTASSIYSFFSFHALPSPVNLRDGNRTQDRDKLQRNHLGDTVEELKRYNARRKLKGAVQAVAGGVALDPLCCADTDSSKFRGILFRFFCLLFHLAKQNDFWPRLPAVDAAGPSSLTLQQRTDRC